MISPTSQPNVRMWYPCFVPGSQIGSWRANAVTIGSHDSTSSSVKSPSTYGKPGLVAQHLSDRDRALSTGRELGPHGGNRRVRIEQTALDEDAGADRRHTLRRRVHEHDRVLQPRQPDSGVGEATPQVDHGFAVEVHAHGCAHFAAVVEVPGEGVEDRLEFRRDEALDSHAADANTAPTIAASMTYTHGHHESVLRSHRWRTVENSAAYVADRFVPGTSVLDIGCGPGTITIDIARRVAPAHVVGLDASADIIEQARRDATGVENVEFRTGDVYALDYDDARFDVVHAHQVLQHVGDPLVALGEMRRVCRPDGVVAARDGDYRAFVWYPESAAIEEWLELYETIARANGGEPDAGRRLFGWAHEAGFSEVRSSATMWCFATPEDRAWWAGLWADRVTTSALGRQAERDGFATRAELEAMAAGWRAWGAEPHGWFGVPSGEILCRP